MTGVFINMPTELTPLIIAQSIHVINKRAKQVPDSNLLYQLKHTAIKKLIIENKAKKLYLHRFKCVQQLHNQINSSEGINKVFIVVFCENYYFHSPANKTDLDSLRFEKLQRGVFNPSTKMKYFKAKRNIIAYLKTTDSFSY